MGDMMADQQIRAKALDAAVRLRAAMLGVSGIYSDQGDTVLLDAKRFENFIRNGTTR